MEVIEPIQFGWVAHMEKEIDEQMMIYNDSNDQNLIRKYILQIFEFIMLCVAHNLSGAHYTIVQTSVWGNCIYLSTTKKVQSVIFIMHLFITKHVKFSSFILSAVGYAGGIL